ncbi:30S ribosomal protein S4e [Candidatus Woesearchaeota archaeon]|nr:30S ribosomal protein S4e [Candidatus Woesearchaeota archaeon]
MVQNHLSRIAAPKTWHVNRKLTKWVARPMPGAHPLDKSLTLSFILRDILSHCKTKKEVNKILNDGNLFVDKKIRKENKFAVGLMDVVELPKLNETYRILFNNKGELSLVSINKTEANLKLLKIVRKNAVKNSKIQITFHDGKNLLMDKFEGRVGDTALFDLTKNSVTKWITLDKGVIVYLSGGKHIGNICKIKDVIRVKNLEKPKVVVEIEGTEYTTLMEYAFVVGEKHPELSLGDKK